MEKTVAMTVEKETKGTWRFSEDGPDDKHVFGTVYVKKSAFGEETPKKIRIQMESVE